MNVDETVRAYDLDGALRDVVAGAGWTDVSARLGIAGRRGESWSEMSAVRDSVSP